MSCSGSHLGIPINIKNTKFAKDLLMIDAQFRFTWTIETKLPRDNNLKVLLKVWVFYADPKSKMAATTGHRN
jgi:hypothetical protein